MLLMPAECKRAGCVRQGRECWLNGLVSWSWVSVLCPLIAPRASLLWVPVIPCSRNVRPNPRSANLCAVSKALRRRRRPPASDRAAKFGVNSVFAGNFALRRVSSRLPTPPRFRRFRDLSSGGGKNSGVSARLDIASKACGGVPAASGPRRVSGAGACGGYLGISPRARAYNSNAARLLRRGV
jgi:hypothetical protein